MRRDKHKGNFYIASLVCGGKGVGHQQSWTSSANKEWHVKK